MVFSFKKILISHLLKITPVYFCLHLADHHWNDTFLPCLLGVCFSLPFWPVREQWLFHWYFCHSFLFIRKILHTKGVEPQSLIDVSSMHPGGTQDRVGWLRSGGWEAKGGFLKSKWRILVKVGLAGSSVKKLKFLVMYYFNLYSLYSLCTWELFGRSLILLAAEGSEVASDRAESYTWAILQLRKAGLESINMQLPGLEGYLFYWANMFFPS